MDCLRENIKGVLLVGWLMVFPLSANGQSFEINGQNFEAVQDHWASMAPMRSFSSLPQRDQKKLEDPSYGSSDSFQNLRSLRVKLPTQRVSHFNARGASQSDAHPKPSAEVLSSKLFSGHIRRLRSPVLSSDRLVVVMQNFSGQEIDYRILPNPFFIRSESFDRDGSIHNVVIEPHPNPEISLSVPLSVDFLVFYQPTRYNGSSVLLPVARVSVY